jgi:hypothetical protein
MRDSKMWKEYPYECAAIPRCLLRLHGTDRVVASYEGNVQFYEENQKVPMVAKAVDVQRRLYEPYALSFSFKDDGNDTYKVKVEMHDSLWVGTYDLFEGGADKPVYQGTLYHVVVEDRQGSLILNASMEEAQSPQHITLRAKCIGEKSEVEDDDVK